VLDSGIAAVCFGIILQNCRTYFLHVQGRRLCKVCKQHTALGDLILGSCRNTLRSIEVEDAMKAVQW
jgi:hypothetical protein